MKRTRFIQLLTALTLAAFAMPEAQALWRPNKGGGGGSLEGKEWAGGPSAEWWMSGKVHNSWQNGSSVAFYSEAVNKDRACTLKTTTVTGAYTTEDLRFYIDHTLIFKPTSSDVYVMDKASGSGAFTLGTTDAPVTLNLQREGTGSGSAYLGISNIDESNGWHGTVVVCTGVALNIGKEGGEIADEDTLTADSYIQLDGGTLNLRRDLRASGKEVTAKHTTYVDAEGVSQTSVSDYFAGQEGATITVATMTANGGTVTNAKKHTITQDSVKYTLRGDGRAENLTEHVDTDYTVFYKGGEGDVAVSKLLETSGGVLTTVELTAGTLTVDALVSTVNAKGGTLAFAAGGSVSAIDVDVDTTVSGDTNPVEGKAYKIAAGKVVTFAEDLQLAGLSIVGAGGTKVTVKNVSGETVQYALNEQNALLSASEVTMTDAATANVNVGNQVAAGTVKNDSGYTLTLGNGNSTVNKVIASTGNIIFHNRDDQAVSLAEMTIGEGKQVGVYQGTVENAASEGTVSISDTLAANGGTLLANLELQAGSTLDLCGGQMILGSTLTLQEGLVQLDAETLDAIAALQNIGDTHILINNYDTTTLSYEGVSNGDWARTHFDLSSITNADYKIVATGTEFGLVKCSNVPEPTTGTLSLLALMALAARRRKH